LIVLEPCDWGAQVAVSGAVEELEVCALVGGGAGDEVVENMEIPLAAGCAGDAVALEVVVERLDALETPTIAEPQLCVFFGPRVAERLVHARVALKCEYGVGPRFCGDVLDEAREADVGGAEAFVW
jgi:hypothetical protein